MNMSKSKRVEEIWKELTPEEHVIRKPGMYLGSVKKQVSEIWLYDNNKMVLKEVEYLAAFIKLFDEIISNSVDESKRVGSKLNTIKVNIKDNYISVWDNGGIPTVIHKDKNQYVAEMVFSSLRAGSNFDDSDDRIVVGTNGLGSVLVNLFSKEFIVSSCDGKKSFYQEFKNNMSERTKPKISNNKNNHTEIKFLTDFEKLSLSEIDSIHYSLIYKRTLDLAGINPHIKFYFNDERLNIPSFQDYVKLYTQSPIFETSKHRWKLAVSPSDKGFRQISFANGASTTDGGSHVDYILNQILLKMREFFQKKHKVDVKPSELKNHMMIFLDAEVINPSFNSQTKEKLITEVKEFGTEYIVSDKFIQSILKSEIVNSILDWVNQKKQADESKLTRELNKNLTKIKVEKLIDAKGKDRWKCSIGIFEGDCLHENTNVRIIDDGNIVDKRIKDVKIDDLVITHNNTISNVYALTKKIKKKATIKIKNEDIICSHSHKWFVYDIEKNEFYFEITSNINKLKHKLVKNYLAFTDSLLPIIKSDGYSITLISSESIITNPDHKFAIYNKDSNKFEMMESKNIDFSIHLLVNTFKL
jgi:DNA topoisomerase-2